MDVAADLANASRLDALGDSDPALRHLNNTACVVVATHDFIFDVVDAVGDTSPQGLVLTLTPYGMLAASLVLCFCGYYALRLVVGLAAFGTGVIGTVRLLNVGGELPVSCDVATLAVLIGGGVGALVAVLMTRVLSTLLGASSACVLVGAVFATCGTVCTADVWPGVPRVLGMTLLPFWASMATAALLGAVVARKHHREMLATVAALAGGFGVAVSLRAIAFEHHERMPHWLFVGAAATSAGVGLGAQYWYVRRREKRKREKKGVA